jgi:predicted amidohydrolase
MKNKIVVLQMNCTKEAEANVNFVEAQLQLLDTSTLTLVCLPEACLAFNQSIEENNQLAEQSDYWLGRYQRLCKTYNVWMNVGSMPIPAPDGRNYAASMLINNAGDVVGRYHKLHLFDVTVADGTGQYRESQGTCPGQHIEVVDTPFGKIGLSICYDMRFPALFSQMRQAGADIILLPSAFTAVTGAAHWHVLLRARAIETQCYIVAAAQVGLHENGRSTYGHSLVVSPWGEVVAEQECGVGMIEAELDLEKMREIRHAMPIINHNRFTEQLI